MTSLPSPDYCTDPINLKLIYESVYSMCVKKLNSKFPLLELLLLLNNCISSILLGNLFSEKNVIISVFFVLHIKKNRIHSSFVYSRGQRLGSTKQLYIFILLGFGSSFIF